MKEVDNRAGVFTIKPTYGIGVQISNLEQALIASRYASSHLSLVVEDSFHGKGTLRDFQGIVEFLL
jgi:hypothetical protein